MRPDSITDWLNKFSEENDLPHIHPHAFRHTAASMMIANGVDLVNAAAELGHATASTTLKYLRPPGGKGARRSQRHPRRCLCGFTAGMTIAHTRTHILAWANFSVFRLVRRQWV